MRMSRIMKVMEKRMPFYFLSEIESLVIANISKMTNEEYFLEGDTVFISNEHYCEDLLIENFILAIGQSLFKKYEHVVYDESLEKEFYLKRRDLYYDLCAIKKDIALSDFLILEMSDTFEKSLRNIDFDELIYNTQKSFINYDSCLSLEKYFSHLFKEHVTGTLQKREFQKFSKIIKQVGKFCKENIKNEQNY